MRCLQRHCFFGLIFERKRARQVLRLNIQLQCCAFESGKNTIGDTPDANSILLRHAIFGGGDSSSLDIKALRIGQFVFALIRERHVCSFCVAAQRSIPKKEKYRFFSLAAFFILIFCPNFRVHTRRRGVRSKTV